MDDLVIRRATILDGSGTPRFVADVAIRAGRIQSIQVDYKSDAAATIDADGRFLAPGFIDSHCHDDLAILRHPDRPEKIAQGVTTVVVGNCGFSLYPSVPHSKPTVQKHASRLLGALTPDEVFPDFAAYRDAVLAQGVALNVMSLVGHGPLRLSAIGYEDRPSTPLELDEMESTLRLQLQQGAAGLS